MHQYILPEKTRNLTHPRISENKHEMRRDVQKLKLKDCYNFSFHCSSILLMYFIKCHLYINYFANQPTQFSNRKVDPQVKHWKSNLSNNFPLGFFFKPRKQRIKSHQSINGQHHLSTHLISEQCLPFIHLQSYPTTCISFIHNTHTPARSEEHLMLRCHQYSPFLF